MTPSRPDPDQLLAQVQADSARAQRGQLRLFFGACAGVGKTCAMLAAAHQALAEGTPLVLGLVETHGRSDTEAMARGLPRLPLKTVPHREQQLQEFDLDAALAFGETQPGALVLLDELAHSNAPGSRHPKRWQDVEELLDAGIHVWSTLNVQHLESLNDIVSGITGVRVRETVPDRVFDQADEVRVVDLAPDELLQRLKAGKVYLGPQAERAAAHFFRQGNLLALRELALRRTADRVDNQMQAFRRQGAARPVWPNRESLLLGLGPGSDGDKLVRRCARLASQLGVDWHVVHVDDPRQPLPEAEHAQVLRLLRLAQDLGASTAVRSGPDVAGVLVRHAREHNLSRLVLGQRPVPRGWQRLRRGPWQRGLARRVRLLADDLDLLQVALPPGTPLPAAPAIATPAEPRWPAYAAALLCCGLAALLAAPLSGWLELSNIVMLFLLAVVVVALRWGRGPAVCAAFVGVGLFDFFFVAPQFSFAVSDVQYLLTFAVMLVVALVIGQLTAGLKREAAAASQREHRVRSLYEMSRDLSAALLPQQVAEIGARFLRSEFGARSALLAADAQDRLQLLPGATTAVDMGMAQWAFDHGEAAGRGTHTLPASPALVLPLKAPMRLRGLLVVEQDGSALPGPEQRRLLDTCASLLAISLERIHYIEVAQASTLQIESERLRNALLSAISHDLRTPLTALVGLADSLALTGPSTAQQEIAQAMRRSALRMNALVTNLLDMARLSAGAVQLNRQWQPLEEVVGSALAASDPALANRPLQLDLAPDLPLLHLDAVLIERVLVNLLENALKYTPAGSPIRLQARADTSQVQLWVEDSGPGLPPGHVEQVFEKFERGRHRESATPGVGLGLALCRAIAQAHGGQVQAENRPGGGARFILSLPRGTPPVDDGSGLRRADDDNPVP